MRTKTLKVVVERDEDGLLFGFVPGMRGGHSQGATMEELLVNLREAIELVIEEEGVESIPVDAFEVREVTVTL